MKTFYKQDGNKWRLWVANIDGIDYPSVETFDTEEEAKVIAGRYNTAANGGANG
jgi:hypothetical protein